MVHQTALSRYGGWLPKSRKIHKAFIDEQVKRAKLRPVRNVEELEPSVAAFKNAIDSDPVMKSLMTKIFEQVSPENLIPDFDSLVTMMNNVIGEAPKFQILPGLESEPIGVPMYLLFDLLSNTGAAYDLFRMPAFNIALKNVLDAWGEYLTTDASNSTLTDKPEGWFGKIALKSLEDGRGDFNSTYITPDPEAVNRGYQSWDEFFTRKLQPNVRPIDDPLNNCLIHSACESTPYRIPSPSESVKAHDQFWLKGQPYSLWDMFNFGPGHNDERQFYVEKFVGGKVYQAFLSPQDYHRWHSPVNGTIVKTFTLPGTYYAVLPDNGAEPDDPSLEERDPHGALIRSQAWLTMNAARAIIFIEADNPDIGLLCFIGVGMAEVSTCDVTVKDQQQVKIGDELGMFHFGGSSHALIFGPHVNITFFDDVVIDQHLWVNSIIAGVEPRK
ncbi:L-tryptophan decarboxylase [Psilocybe cubensis]|uniref:L-tryptophan decarboxylase PsiD-like domain-containing protein n=2 Tax=Psilocybe cubensis TaxID=181762 RepID=A0A8H7XS55_PSICU|nr:L-tryptophan decarboxylase [Psilocybe cubensis]KAH9477927.1 L-tryptophan decarboxylase [Psilocybe cubensis]